ncbi:EAL domain-containing protein [Pseudoduganella eburnea]|uniref:EAL domain-containing protein n=1 Tax=Massilia eburnea TaxID=1776165 RepID=A0A6L6QG85_9BURK|nr:EAL domain-containing protein [Massilia eburnea]MTW10907.1 EAL domain-containing protein [Massilia eburnea]
MENAPYAIATRTLQRERAARKEAESLLEQKSRELYEKNQFLQESELRYRNLVELAPDAIWIHSEGRLTFLNQAALRLFGATCQEQLLGTPAMDRVPEQFRSTVDAWTSIELNKVHQGPRSGLQLLRLDGTLVEVEFYGCSIRFNNRDSVMHAAHDVTERLQQVAIRHRATHDELTGLANRAYLLERLGEEIDKARCAGTSLAVAFVDLDKFKQINDTRGHAVGDELLRVVADVLRSCVRDGDVVARLGGDEFVLLLDSSTGQLTPAMLAERISERLAEPVMLAGQQHIITGSIGLSVYPDDGQHPEELLRQADIAMYHCKGQRCSGVQFFTKDMQRRLDARLTMEQGLLRALKREEFVLHFQPQVDLRSGAIIGLEALLRWQSPDLGLVPPMEFIPVAEETKLIVDIGKWVLEKTCATLREWQDAGVPVVRVAVNIAASQFARHDFDTTVEDALGKHGLDPGLLELELTESLSMEDPKGSIALMQRLRAIGINMAIDDFGTGYSNLSYLKRFPVDRLKIDKSFTSGLATNSEDHAIVTAVISLAHSLGLKAIAEGVETEDQLQLLRAEGCDEIQGYYFSKPLPEAAAREMLLKRPCLHC